MKVHELIKKLETMEQNKEVVYSDSDFGWTEVSVEDVFDLDHVDIWDSSKKGRMLNRNVVAIG